MKISELIEDLEFLKRESGDIEVRVNGNTGSPIRLVETFLDFSSNNEEIVLIGEWIKT